MAAARKTQLAKLAADSGYELQEGPGQSGWRLVDAQTGTLQAAVWTNKDGFGLSLDDIETALRAD